MRKKFLLLVGVLTLAVTAIAPAAQASTISLLNLKEEPVDTVNFNFNYTYVDYWENAISCPSVTFSGTVTKNETDPVAIDPSNGGGSKCSGYSASYALKLVPAGPLVLYVGGTGEYPVQAIVEKYPGSKYAEKCYWSGTLQVGWESKEFGENSVELNGNLAGEGSHGGSYHCTVATAEVEMSSGSMTDSEGEPISIVTSP